MAGLVPAIHVGPQEMKGQEEFDRLCNALNV
jgi:hypothetical protein